MYKSITIILLAMLPFSANADWSMFGRYSYNMQGYSSDFLSGDYVVNAIGFTALNSNGVYLDVELYMDGGSGEEPDSVWDRTDRTYTAGYRLDQGWSIFGGMKDNRTQGTDADDVQWEMETTGFFVGAAKTLPLDVESNVSVSLAVGSVSGDLNMQNFNTDEDITTDASALGLSSSLAYNFVLSKKVNASLGFRYSNYDYEDQGAETITTLFGKVTYQFR